MWIYEKRLQYPVNITKTDARIAKIIATQYGGPDGEIGAIDALPLPAFHRSEPCLHGGSYRCSDRRTRTSRNGIHDRSSAELPTSLWKKLKTRDLRIIMWIMR